MSVELIREIARSADGTSVGADLMTSGLVQPPRRRARYFGRGAGIATTFMVLASLGHRAYAQTDVGPVVITGTETYVATTGGCTSTATLTAQFYAQNSFETWSDILNMGASSLYMGTLSYNAPCLGVSSAGTAIQGSWIYDGTQFFISWNAANNLQYSVANAFGSGVPPTFVIPVTANANGVTGSGTATPLNGGTTKVTLNLSAQGGTSPPPGASPAIASLSPSSATAGGAAFTLTVNGSNFASGATVQWNGTSLATTVVSSTQLTASVSANLIGSPGTASITVSSGGQTSAPATFTINPVSGGGSSVTVVTKLTSTTTGVVNGSCVQPPAVTSFTTSSPQVWLYFAVTGDKTGDTVQIKWIRPDGVVYAPETTTLGSNYSCFAYYIDISGTAAASYPGTWTVQAFWNQAATPLFSLNFTITSATGGSSITYANQRVSTQDPSSSNTCVVPPAGSSFLTTNNTVYLYFDASTTTSDNLSDDWLAPDGSVLNAGSWTPTAGNSCYFDSLDISSLLAGRLGSWQARVYDNGAPLFSVPFTVAAPQTSNAPTITSVSNAASYAGGAVAPGEIVYIAGSGMGPGQVATLTLNIAGIVNTQLAGTSVQVNGIAAPMVYTLAAAVAAVVPYEVSDTSAQVTVTYQGQTSAPFQVSVASSVPGLFTANSSGTGQVAALNGDGSVNNSNHLASPGSTVTLFATGEGQTSPSGVDGKPVAVPLPRPLLPVTVTIGGVNAPVSYAGGAPGEVAGVMQINAQIPAGVGGSAAPIMLRVGNAQSQSGATLAVTGTSSTVLPAIIQIVSGNAQTAPVNQAFAAPLLVKVLDSQGNPLSGTPVTWAVSQGSATLDNPSTSTDASGEASATALSGNSAGTVVITAGAGSITTQFTLTVTAGGTTSVSIYSSGQNVTSGTDNSYQIVADTTGQVAAPAPAVVVTSLPGGWGTIPGAAWIAPSADQSNATRNPCCANTSDRYRTTFTVTGSPAGVSLNLTIAADDYVDVLLNGGSVFTHPNTGMWGTPIAFSINSGFVSGTNTLDFQVTNGGGPTGLIVAITPAISGLTQAVPGQTLAIAGNFNTTAGATTTVTFSDNAGYQLAVPALSVAQGSVTVLVPPYLNVQQQDFTTGSVTVSVAQRLGSGPSTTTNPVSLQVAGLPQTGLPPGSITLDVFTQLAQLAASANQSWSTISQKSGGAVNSSMLGLQTLQSNFASIQSQIQNLMSGSVSQADLGQIGGRQIYLDNSSLALMDQLFYAYYEGSSAGVVQVQPRLGARALRPLQEADLQAIHDWFAGVLHNTANGLRVVATVAETAAALIGVGVVAGAIAVSAPVIVAAAGLTAIGLAAAAEAVALETAANQILQNPPDVQDFQNTMGGLGSYSLPQIVNSMGVTGGQADDNIAAEVPTIAAAVDPGNLNGLTAETVAAANAGLFNTALPLTGTWMGTYTRTPSSGCPSYSGLMSMSATQYSDGTFGGSATMTNVNTYDSNCKVTDVGNVTDGGLLGGSVTGFDATGHATFKGSLDWCLDQDLTCGTFTFTGTLVNGSVNGVFDKGGGTFTLH